MFSHLCGKNSLLSSIPNFTKRFICKSRPMANSRFDYVRNFEQNDSILPNCWIVVRIDGKAFHKFTQKHDFNKPNDDNGLNLMSYAAVQVLKEFNEIVLAFGQSDEYSFIFHKTADVYSRRASKIVTCVNSLFTSSYVFHWGKFFEEKQLLYPPSFDARIVLYPSDENLRDYLSWRQADTHINNLYNTVFWKLVLEGGRTNTEAQKDLSGTYSSDKNEILFSRFGINYNNLPQMYRKGTILLRKNVEVPKLNGYQTQLIVPFFTDLIQDKFWIEHPEILTKDKSQNYELDDEQLNHPIMQKQFDIVHKRKNNNK
ncbi:probable tRNA(His) guanylyltransferase [Contarinia nasturtii]|uniref:probable tRNA(His) guanylyltransferase n=1 Tax=Contarinia nasturtii TaxID=265458 RepID=UPI0012D3CA72|nr:probable tRNA(His) guanylyltransferase [Contarinia nasturtii]